MALPESLKKEKEKVDTKTRGSFSNRLLGFISHPVDTSQTPYLKQVPRLPPATSTRAKCIHCSFKTGEKDELCMQPVGAVFGSLGVVSILGSSNIVNTLITRISRRTSSDVSPMGLSSDKDNEALKTRHFDNVLTEIEDNYDEYNASRDDGISKVASQIALNMPRRT